MTSKSFNMCLSNPFEHIDSNQTCGFCFWYFFWLCFFYWFFVNFTNVLRLTFPRFLAKSKAASRMGPRFKPMKRFKLGKATSGWKALKLNFYTVLKHFRVFRKFYQFFQGSLRQFSGKLPQVINLLLLRAEKMYWQLIWSKDWNPWV